MKRLISLLPVLTLLGILWTLPTACTDEQTQLGNNISGSDALYEGKTHTLYADRALSVRDDSLMTTGYNAYNTHGIIGNYHDAIFGKVSSTLYTQIALPTNYSSINFGEMTIDSVVLTLVKEQLYPDKEATYNFHFEVMQLAEALQSDTFYYSNHSLAVNPAGCFYDGDVSVSASDTVIRIPLGNGIADVLRQTATSEEFIQTTKGLRVRLTDAGSEGMMTINFAATKTCLSVYYRYRAEDTVSSRYVFLLGTGTTRFSQFVHDYSGSTTGGADSIPGNTTLYIEPLAGYSILLSFDSAIRAFAAEHPMATIHHAELLLPVADEADNMKPDQMLARHATGNQNYVADLLDLYTLTGFDGKYDDSRHCYRLRLTQHVQSLLRNGSDEGTMILLDSRQSSAARTVLKGITGTDRVRIEIVYTE